MDFKLHAKYGYCKMSFMGFYKNPVLRIRDVYLRSRILIFIHPGSRIQQKYGTNRGGNFFCPTIFCSHKYNKIVNNYIFEQVKNFLKPKH
jgi:hypothetical protein